MEKDPLSLNQRILITSFYVLMQFKAIKKILKLSLYFFLRFKFPEESTQ
jgi:hypothetical protein